MSVALDAGEMLKNFAESYEAIFNMLTAGAYVAGIGFGLLSIYSLKEYGEQRSMMSTSTSIRPSLMYMLIAMVFLYLPSAVDVLMMSTFGESAIPIADGSTTGSVVSVDIQLIIFRIVQLVGLISFIRGWFILSQSAKSGGQPVMGKALTHIIGGVLAINIVGTKSVIQATFGLS